MKSTPTTRTATSRVYFAIAAPPLGERPLEVQKLYLKVGISRDPAGRIGGVQCGCPFDVYLIGTYGGSQTHARRLEKSIHQLFEEFHLRGEWFDASNSQIWSYVKFFLNEPLGSWSPEFKHFARSIKKSS